MSQETGELGKQLSTGLGPEYVECDIGTGETVKEVLMR